MYRVILTVVLAAVLAGCQTDDDLKIQNEEEVISLKSKEAGFVHRNYSFYVLARKSCYRGRATLRFFRNRAYYGFSYNNADVVGYYYGMPILSKKYKNKGASTRNVLYTQALCQ